MTGLLILALVLGAGGEVSETRTWEAHHAFVASDPPTVTIENIWGDVSVIAHESSTVEIDVKETRSASSVDWLERSRDILDFRVVHDDAGVLVTLRRGESDWNQRPCRGCRLDAGIRVRVPVGAAVAAGTVNDGAVRVSGVRGTVRATNVNGPVTVSGASRCDRISSVNGHVTIEFATPPMHERCIMETINGDLRLELPEGANADFSLLSGRGRVDSEFELTTRPSQPVLERLSTGLTNHFRLTQGTELRLGSGGPVFTFDSMNGDVEIAHETTSRRNMP